MVLGVSAINFVVITILPALPCGGNEFFKASGDVQYISKRVADLRDVHLVLWVSIVSLKSERLKLKKIRTLSNFNVQF